MSQELLDQRKKDHIALTDKSQILSGDNDTRFYYEPLFGGHPTKEDIASLKVEFLGKTMKAPIWVSSMTGGTEKARIINHNLAEIAGEFGLGMGLGSCRSLLESNKHFEDFNLRPILGDAIPLFANLGIAQVEKSLFEEDLGSIFKLVESLKADGLIIHVNPLQEYFQPEGDRLSLPPIETIERVVALSPIPIIVKEVGQGFGPESLLALMRLPLAAIDFGAFGGTNFSKLEVLRHENHEVLKTKEFMKVGHTAEEMVILADQLLQRLGDQAKCREIIISGGVRSPLDGFYLMQKLKGGKSVYGQAKPFLDHALEGPEALRKFVRGQLEGLALAHKYLRIKE